MKDSAKINSQVPVDPLSSKRDFVTASYDKIAEERDGWIQRNLYYYNYLKKILNFLVEPHQRVLQVKSETGFFLHAVDPSYGVGIDSSAKMSAIAREKFPDLHFYVQPLERVDLKDKFDYILLINALGDVVDVQELMHNLSRVSDAKTRIIIVNYNYLWEPLLKLATRIKLKIPQPTQNWLSPHDIDNLLSLSGYEVIKKFNAILFPKYLPCISNLVNNVIARLPFLRSLCLDYVCVARKNISRNNYSNYSVSVIIPCRNERGNIENAVRRIPEMGSHTEIIFSDDKSDDGTPDEVIRVKRLYPEKDIRLVHGPGVCKADNVWSAFEHARGDILMILDADLTVIPEELPYFFRALVEGKGEFINGSRLVYPMQRNAMKISNTFGNKFFSLLFSYIIGENIKDTLCGTKVLWREDYLRMEKYIGTWGIKDLWGDHDLLFSASKLNLKIIDLPVHYVDRSYGQSKMSKVLSNGLRMLAKCWTALIKMRFF